MRNSVLEDGWMVGFAGEVPRFICSDLTERVAKLETSFPVFICFTVEYLLFISCQYTAFRLDSFCKKYRRLESLVVLQFLPHVDCARRGNGGIPLTVCLSVCLSRCSIISTKTVLLWLHSDVKRGQFLEVETKAEAKNNYEKKYEIMINNIRFTIIAGKIDKIPEFYTIFARKMPPDYIIRQRDRGRAEAKCLRPRPKFWP